MLWCIDGKTLKKQGVDLSLSSKSHGKVNKNPSRREVPGGVSIPTTIAGVHFKIWIWEMKLRGFSLYFILFMGLAYGFQGELKMAILTWRQRPILVKIVKNSNLYHVGKWRWLTATFVKDKLCVLQIAENWRFEDSG